MTTPTPPDDWRNKLYFGDNLPIMQEHVPDESVDLIYLDPPFNSSTAPPPSQPLPQAPHGRRDSADHI